MDVLLYFDPGTQFPEKKNCASISSTNTKKLCSNTVSAAAAAAAAAVVVVLSRLTVCTERSLHQRLYGTG